MSTRRRRQPPRRARTSNRRVFRPPSAAISISSSPDNSSGGLARGGVCSGRAARARGVWLAASTRWVGPRCLREADGEGGGHLDRHAAEPGDVDLQAEFVAGALHRGLDRRWQHGFKRDGRGVRRIGRGDLEPELAGFRYADLLADQPCRFGLDARAPGRQGRVGDEQQLAMVAIADDAADIDALRRRPADDGCACVIRSRQPQHQRLARIAGVAPVGVPARLHRHAQAEGQATVIDAVQHHQLRPDMRRDDLRRWRLGDRRAGGERHKHAKRGACRGVSVHHHPDDHRGTRRPTPLKDA